MGVEGRQPLVSVVTPTYNHARFIRECIESVISQSYPHWEMLILDDGSSDGTADAAEAVGDPRVRVIRQPNRGLAHLRENYNRLLGESRGELIAILEGDDLWPREKLSTQVPDFEDESVVLSSGLTSLVDEHGTPSMITPGLFPPFDATHNRPVGKAALYMMHPERLTFTFPVSTVVRKSALERIGGFQQPAYLPLVDLPTFLRLAIEGEFRFHDAVLGRWRRHGESTTSDRLPLILEGAYRLVFEFAKEHRDRLPATEEEMDELERLWSYFEVQRCMLRGRWLASERRWKLAQKAFAEAAVFHRTRPMRIATSAATVLSKLHLSPEPMFKLTGRPRWQDTIRVAGDMLVAESDLNRPRVRHSWRSG